MVVQEMETTHTEHQVPKFSTLALDSDLTVIFLQQLLANGRTRILEKYDQKGI